MSSFNRPTTAKGMGMSLAEGDTFALAKLLVTVAKEEPITDQQREFAALLFIRMDNAVKANQRTNHSTTTIRPDLRATPIFHRKKRGR